MSPEEDAPERVRELLERVVEAFGLDAEVDVVEEQGTITGTVQGTDVGLFIGRRGQTIDAVQHLAARAAFPAPQPGRRVVIDAAGWRDRREQALHAAAEQAAADVLREGQPVALEAMGAAERRIVHEHLKERSGIETYSEGTDPERHLVVAPLVSS